MNGTLCFNISGSDISDSDDFNVTVSNGTSVSETTSLTVQSKLPQCTAYYFGKL